MNHIYSLKTRRLYLREIEYKDAGTIVEWRSKPENYQYFFNPKPITIQEHIKWFLDVYQKDLDRLDWMCFRKEEEEAIGVFGIRRRKADSTGCETEISYLLDQKAQHLGYGKEAITALQQWAVIHWNTTVFLAAVHRENESSKRFAEKLGFSLQKASGNFLIYQRFV